MLFFFEGVSFGLVLFAWFCTALPAAINSVIFGLLEPSVSIIAVVVGNMLLLTIYRILLRYQEWHMVSCHDR